ncbi:hypothetical protein [Duganella sp. CF517]|uniref:hypothetical protein n=1 Tax=Duganella sp. CF517 TaxID=1881038 RepID=UPI0015A6ACD3|nr:hypothetical protein [Duganella sp. CF517]
MSNLIFGRAKNTGARGLNMPSTAIKRVATAALIAISTAAASATGRDKPPQFLTVPVLGLRVPLEGINVEPLPEDVRIKCPQLYDDQRYTAHMWIFGRAKDAASSYYVLAGYYKRSNPGPGRQKYEIAKQGTVFTVTGDKCGGDGADETFWLHDPNADSDGNVPDRVLKMLAVDLAARTVRAFGGRDRLVLELKAQRVDFEALPPELRKAFNPYFEPKR